MALLTTDEKFRFNYTEAEKSEAQGYDAMSKYLKHYMQRFFQAVADAARNNDKIIGIALGNFDVKRALLVALGGWAGQLTSEELSHLCPAERRDVDLTRGCFKLLIIEIEQFLFDPSKWSIHFYDVDSRYTYAMEYGFNTVSIWQALSLVLFADNYIFVYLLVMGYGLIEDAAVKIGASASDPLVCVQRWICAAYLCFVNIIMLLPFAVQQEQAVSSAGLWQERHRGTESIRK